MILIQRNCTANIPPANELPTATMSQLCLRIYVESCLIADANFPDAYRDLFMEQGQIDCLNFH